MLKAEFDFIDLFAGIGGFRIGLESYGGRCVFSSEIDKYARKTYSENFNETPAGDIREIESENIPNHDVLCAGFPCQAFSISGNQKGFEDTRGTLFYEIARIADYHKPKILFLENVKNLISHNDGETIKVIKKTLNEIGYNIYYEVINASYYGIPQSRERVFIIGIRKDLDIDNFSFPDPTMESVAVKDILQSDKLTEKYVKDREVKWKDEEKNNQLSMFDKKTTQVTFEPNQIGIVNKGRQGERVYSIDGHAITLSANGGGLFSKTGGYYVNGKVRKLSPRECARLMGFTDDFKIPVSDNQAYKQFGNSVVVPVVKMIFAKILETGALNKNKEINCA